MNRSFMSEKSAEFILIPNLVNILSQNFRMVIPIHFWASREGNNLSRECDDNKKLFVFAMYARRPKIEKPLQPTIVIKINRELFDYAKYLEANGIPVIAGVPVISSIMDIDSKSYCLWFKIDSNNEETSDICYEISIEQNEIINSNPRNAMNYLITDTDIIKKVIKKYCHSMTWNNAIDIIRGLGKKNKESYTSYSRFPFPWFERYKPIYFLLRN